MSATASGNPRRWASLAAAIVVLDVSLTFENIWPTPAVWWTGGVSVELAVCMLALAGLAAWARPAPRTAIGVLSAAWILLALGRYVEVTAPALYGRDINLYWDLRFIPDVIAMVTRVAPVWLLLAAGATVIAALVLVFRALRWALTRVNTAMCDPRVRRPLAVGAAVAIVLFAAQRLVPGIPRVPAFPPPVVQTYAHQIALVRTARSGSTSLPASPPMTSSFANVKGADVFLVFVESYGAVSYTPPFAPQLAASRQRLAADIEGTNRHVVSAYVESPTFGGSSWLAHLSLVSGIEVRDPDTNALLMTQRRDTLVKAFGRSGFRTVALMPGLRQRWPEGSFYGFDEIYGADRLAYSGPEFGWFALPDEFSLARFDALEAHATAQPRFVFFPTISTHFPFSPTPPYQPDWTRMLTDHPYDQQDLNDAYGVQPDWTDFAPGYVNALAYDFAVLGGYLRQHADRDIVMVLIGDHQPAAAVSGEGAPWNVPVHVIASRPAVLDALRAHGFRPGLDPGDRALTRMHALLPILLDAFGSPHD